MATTTTAIEFTATVERVGAIALARLPASASERLPSRGQVAVQGEVNGQPFTAVLEPDGRKGHWLRVEDDLQRRAGVSVGDQLRIAVEQAARWPEPEVPADLAAELAAAPPQVREVWQDITPMARWEWVRWVNATANPATRARRVEVTIDKIRHGKRRPCCFDLSACTDPAVSSSGKLRTAG